jgi:hypothetical protein
LGGGIEDALAVEEGFEDGDLAGDFVQAETDQIGALTGV